MKKIRRYRKGKALLLAGVVALLYALPGTVSADARKTSLTIEERSTTTGKLVPGVEISVYQVADMDERWQYNLTEDFRASGLELSQLESADGNLKAAKKMNEWIEKQSLSPGKSAVTGEDGLCTMADLNQGLYLILTTGTPGTKLIVQSEPFFVSLPMLDAETNTWIYDVTAQPKVTTKEPETDSSEAETNPSESETNPSDAETNPSQPETNPSEPETNPSESETTPGGGGNNGGGGGGNHGGGGGNSGGGGGTTTIEDTPTPLASFPQVPAEPELITIEDGPVPLAGLPMIPKLGDMGATGYLAGLLISLAACAAALKKQRDYSAKES